MMQKRFNDTGVCIPYRHYMVDTSVKLKQIIQLVERGEYFTINRPRQFGKTTTLFQLDKALNRRDDYVALKISFEGIDTDTHQHQERFITEFLILIAHRLEFLGFSHPSQLIEEHRSQITNLPALSRFLTKLIKTMPTKSWVLMIDEVDKSSNNQLFLDFLGMLRNKYLQQNEGRDHSFQSVILVGVHDIKTLKAKSGDYNSPWNIAIDFKVDLSFAPHEIETMLQDYSLDKQIQLDISAIAERLYYYTAGYPYLVSKLCKFIDEDIIPNRAEKNWSVEDVEAAFKMIVDGGYTTTLFDSLTKNLENNRELYNFVSDIVINGKRAPYIITSPMINFANLYGIIANVDGFCQIHNRIYEQRIYAHLVSNLLVANRNNLAPSPDYFTADGLDVKLILQRFQAFMRENYGKRDRKRSNGASGDQFLEREGRLLFLAFLKPIMNGRGFDFKEPTVADEQRLDLVITYQDKRYVIELKRWYGEKYHQRGLKKLSDYLDIYSLKKGYLLIYDFNKGKSYKEKLIQFQDKDIFAVWV
jgi:hypothetical protein